MAEQTELGQEHPPEGESLFDKATRLGVDMSWYHRGKAARGPVKETGPVPLNDDACSMLSIYLLDKDGKMWTTTSDGSAYENGLVRTTGKKLPRDIYICAHCREQFSNYKSASEHYTKVSKSIDKSQ